MGSADASQSKCHDEVARSNQTNDRDLSTIARKIRKKNLHSRHDGGKKYARLCCFLHLVYHWSPQPRLQTKILSTDARLLLRSLPAMLSTPDPDPQIEFVAEQLKRVRWISGYRFKTGQGYLLEWLPEGINRMLLLQIAVRERNLDQNSGVVSELPGTEVAVQDFWNACVQQLGIANGATTATLVKIIESWKAPV